MFLKLAQFWNALFPIFFSALPTSKTTSFKYPQSSKTLSWISTTPFGMVIRSIPLSQKLSGPIFSSLLPSVNAIYFRFLQR